MRQLLPLQLEEVDLREVYADLPVADGRPAVRLNMISSVDGATAVDGLSGGLGGMADRQVFGVLRSFADAVLVAAGTVRAEKYGPSALPLAIVTRSCDLDFDAPLFTAAGARPLVVTADAAPDDRLARAAEVADVVIAGESTVDVDVALHALADRGIANLLVEGGPSLNGQLAAADRIDELCLTLSPRLVGGVAARIVHGMPAESGGRPLLLRSVCEQDGYLFLRMRPDR
jgi:riboflavin biosynthesis pyrimidine reductase